MESFDLSSRDAWKSRAALYADGSRQADQACEDLVARRIIRGLGYTEKGLYDLESSLYLPYDQSKTLFDRARTCMEIVSRGMFSSDRGHRRYALACRQTDERHSPILRNLDEWFSMAEAEKEGLVVMGRVGKNRIAWGYVVTRDTVLPPWILQHPAVLVQRRDGFWVWYREVSDLVYDMARLEHWDIPGGAAFGRD